MSLPDEKEAGKAYRFLEESEEPYARAVGRKERMDAELKVARDSAFLVADGTVAERQATAGTCMAYLQALAEVEEAYVAVELLKAKRKRAEIAIEMYRTLEASRRKGWA